MAVVMVLAAGFGTRLQPLTNERPKALVPLGDRPVLAHQIERIRAQLGEVPILVNAHHRAVELVAYMARYDASVRVIEEKELLGTAGGLRAALEPTHEDPLLVVNSDVISTANYRELIEIVTVDSIVMRVAPRPIGQGPVGVDVEGRIVRLRGEHFGIEASGGDYLGVAAIGADVARRLPEQGCLVADFMLPWLRSGFAIRALLRTCHWIDLGTPDEYFRANADWLRQRSLDSWVSPLGVLSDSIALESSIVGEGAQLLGKGLVRRVIAWPFAQVPAPLQNAIVTSRGVIVRVSEQEFGQAPLRAE